MDTQGQHIDKLKSSGKKRWGFLMIGVLVLASLVICTVSLIGPHKANADGCNAGESICPGEFIPQSIQSSIVAYDGSILDPYPSGSPLQYTKSWVSVPIYTGTGSTVSVPANSTKPISLVVNTLIFFNCNLIVAIPGVPCPYDGSANDDGVPPNTSLRGSVKGQGDPNALVSEATLIDSCTMSLPGGASEDCFTQSSAGSISGITPEVSTLTVSSPNGSAQSSSRYWFGNLPFTYTPPPNGFTQSTPVSINFMVQKINDFNGNYECVGGGGFTSKGDFTNCVQATAPVTITFTQPPWLLKAPITGAGTTIISPATDSGVIYAGQKATVNVNTYNFDVSPGAGPSPANTQLELAVTSTPGGKLSDYGFNFPGNIQATGCPLGGGTGPNGSGPNNVNTPACLYPQYWLLSNIFTNNAVKPGSYGPTETFTFEPSTSTPDGSQICLKAWAAPPYDGAYVGNPSGYVFGIDGSGNNPCFTVINPKFPAYATTNGDVNAGGEVTTGSCPTSVTTPNPNLVDEPGTTFGADDLAQYLASATNSISSGLSSAAQLGVHGYYAPVCRPNLATAAQNYMKANPTLIRHVGSTIGTDSLSGITKQAEVVLPPAGNVTIDAQAIHLRTTIYVDGNVNIVGNLTYSGSCSGSTIPYDCGSLGIIASGNITIAPNVTTIDGFLSAGNPTNGNPSANGSIYTCNSNTSPSSTCQLLLTVNGFLQGRTIYFGRICPATASGGACLAEQANLSALLYLATPPAFGLLSNGGVGPQYVGEQPPLD